MLGDMWGTMKQGAALGYGSKPFRTARAYAGAYGAGAGVLARSAWGRVPAGARPYAIGAAALTAYGTAYNTAPGAMTMGTIAAGAGIGMHTARYRTGTMRTAAGRFQSYSRRTGQFLAGGRTPGARRLGAGVIGAVGGMGVAMASRALFGPSSKSNTTLGSNR